MDWRWAGMLQANIWSGIRKVQIILGPRRGEGETCFLIQLDKTVSTVRISYWCLKGVGIGSMTPLESECAWQRFGQGNFGFLVSKNAWPKGARFGWRSETSRDFGEGLGPCVIGADAYMNWRLYFFELDILKAPQSQCPRGVNWVWLQRNVRRITTTRESSTDACMLVWSRSIN